jgi:hypothetical protein
VGSDRLAEAIAAFLDTDSVETQQRVLDELATSELIFPAAERGPRDAGVQLAFIQDQRGRPILTGFTDEPHLSLWQPGGGPYAKAPAAAFLPTAIAGPFAGLVLNPGSEASAFVDRRALQLLAAGKAAHVADNKGEALVQEWTSAKR